MLKRVWYYVTRKRVKTCIMALVLFGIATAMLSGIAIKKAAAVSKDKLYESIGAGFSVRNNMEYNMGNYRGAGNIPGKMLDELEKLPGITKTLRRMVGLVDLENAHLVELPAESQGYREDSDQVSDILGVDRSALDNKFLSGALQLEEGRHLESQDKGKALVHEEFAKKNGLKIGDKLKMKASSYDLSNQNPSTEAVETEIVGLFSGKNLQMPSMMGEMCENIIMTDLDTIRTLYNYTKESEIYQDATFFTENPASLETVMKNAQELPLDWKNYTMLANGTEFTALTRSVEGINGLVDTLLKGAFIAGVLILSLILFLWIHGRTKETGIMMALGISKGTILAQYILELLLIGAVSFTLAFFAGRGIAQSIGDSFVQQSAQSAQRSVRQEASVMLGADVETSNLIRTIDHVDVEVGLSDMVQVWGMGIVVILISVSLSSIPVIRMKPKEILSQMS